MLNETELKEALNFLEIENQDVITKTLECAKYINENCLDAFEKTFDLLNNQKYEVIRTLWGKKGLAGLFEAEVPEYTSNVMILAGVKTYKQAIKEYGFDEEDIKIQKYRLKRSFSGPVSLTILLWLYHFLRGRLIEVGRLQFEYTENSEDAGKNVYMHIPAGEKLTAEAVKEAMKAAEEKIERYYGAKRNEYKFRCNSWLLSNQLNALLPETSNIKQFYNLFEVTDMTDCKFSVMTYVFDGLPQTTPVEELPEKTSLQRLVKEHWLKGEVFLKGSGTVKQ